MCCLRACGCYRGGNVTEFALYADRICFTVEENREIVFHFRDLVRTSRTWWLNLFFRDRVLYVGERDFCRDERFFRWFTDPEISVYTPEDPPGDSYKDTWFCKIHEVMNHGPFRTYDLA